MSKRDDKLVAGAQESIDKGALVPLLRALEATGVTPEARLYALACAVVCLESLDGAPDVFDEYLAIVRQGQEDFGGIMHKLAEA
jgi:hypothetical protein